MAASQNAGGQTLPGNSREPFNCPPSHQDETQSHLSQPFSISTRREMPLRRHHRAPVWPLFLQGALRSSQTQEAAHHHTWHDDHDTQHSGSSPASSQDNLAFMPPVFQLTTLMAHNDPFPICNQIKLQNATGTLKTTRKPLPGETMEMADVHPVHMN